MYKSGYNQSDSGIMNVQDTVSGSSAKFAVQIPIKSRLSESVRAVTPRPEEYVCFSSIDNSPNRVYYVIF